MAPIAGKHVDTLLLADASSTIPVMALGEPIAGAAGPPSAAGPDALLIAATQTVLAGLKQDRNLQANDKANDQGKFAELIESSILPLFDFSHMTQLAMARNWRLASADQQGALVTEFKGLLVRTYSAVLAGYRDQVIQYRPLRVGAADTEVTVKSVIKQAGAEQITIDYDMEKTAAGWKVYDIKIAGISLITNYQAEFSQTIHDSGVDGLIRALSAKNHSANSRIRSEGGVDRYFVFRYAATPANYLGNLKGDGLLRPISPDRSGSLLTLSTNPKRTWS